MKDRFKYEGKWYRKGDVPDYYKDKSLSDDWYWEEGKPKEDNRFFHLNWITSNQDTK